MADDVQPWFPSNPAIQAILASCQDIVMVTEPRLERPGPIIVYVNKAFERVTGYRANEVIGRSPRLLQGPRTDRKVLREMKEALRQGRSHTVELVNYTKEHREYRVAMHVMPLMEDGRVKNYLSVERDVTEQRRFEAFEEAQEFNETIGHMVGGLRHELANPINSMKAALSVLQDGFQSFPIGKTALYLERLTDEVRRLEDLLRSLKTFTAFERLQMGPVDVDPFVKRLVHPIAADFEQRGIVLEMGPVMSPAPKMWVDAQALHQALVNVLVNAQEAVSEQKSARVTFEVQATSHWVTFTVGDNGPGISDRDLARIFHPFYTTKADGTGLGLHLTSQMVHRMHGNIEVDAAMGQGTRVTIQVPTGGGADGPSEYSGIG